MDFDDAGQAKPFHYATSFQRKPQLALQGTQLNLVSRWDFFQLGSHPVTQVGLEFLAQESLNQLPQWLELQTCATMNVLRCMR